MERLTDKLARLRDAIREKATPREQNSSQRRILVLGSNNSGARHLSAELNQFLRQEYPGVDVVHTRYVEDFSAAISGKAELSQIEPQEQFDGPPLGIILYPEVRSQDFWDGANRFLDVHYPEDDKNQNVASYVRELSKKARVPVFEISQQGLLTENSKGALTVFRRKTLPPGKK